MVKPEDLHNDLVTEPEKRESSPPSLPTLQMMASAIPGSSTDKFQRRVRERMAKLQNQAGK